jgi:hypothetical protein
LHWTDLSHLGKSIDNGEARREHWGKSIDNGEAWSSESIAAALAEYSNHKIRGKWVEVKSAVSPHLLASNHSSSSPLLEAPKSPDATAIEPPDALPISLTPRTQVPLHSGKKPLAQDSLEQDAPPILLTPRTLPRRKKPLAQDSHEKDFCQPWKVPVSLPTKTVSAADPPVAHSTLSWAEDLPTPPACDLMAIPWPGNVVGDDADGFANCYCQPDLLSTPGGLSDAWTHDGSSALFPTSKALQQSLAELFKQEALRFKEVQLPPTAAGRHGH